MAHYWSPRRAVKGAPAFLQMIRLDDAPDDAIAARCRELTARLRADLAAMEAPAVYDGTIASLVDCYRVDPTSGLRNVKHSTRSRDYEPSMRVLVANVGKRRVDRLVGSDFRRWFDNWRLAGHRRAYGAIKMLRILLTYGAGERLPGCAEARAILSGIRFEQPAPRGEAQTVDHVRAIMVAAIAAGRASIAFTEALKFEAGLRRIDVIGEWAPDGEGPFKWRGLMAHDLRNMRFDIRTSKTGAPRAGDLTVMPLVVEAMKHYALPDIGPAIICEATGKPWRDDRYVRAYAGIRAAAGLPDTIWSMDTRAGAVTETIAATGSIAAAQQLAAHTTAKTTARYVRSGDLDGARRIAEARTRIRASATPVQRSATDEPGNE